MSNTSLLGSFGGQAGDALMFRNVLINGNFDVWQRGTTGANTGSFLGSYPSADRWKFLTHTSTVGWVDGTLTQSTDTPSSDIKYSVKVVSTSAALDDVVVFQTVEAVNAQSLAGKPATLSFWCKKGGGLASAKTFKYAVRYLNTADVGTNAPLTMDLTTLIQEATISSTSLSSSWTKITMSIPAMPSQAANGICVEFRLDDDNLGSGDLLFFSQIQLEAGPTATPFERRPIGTELALAQRYYYLHARGASSPISQSGWYASTLFQGAASFPVAMRIAPDIEYSSGTNYYVIYWNNTSLLITAPYSGGLYRSTTNFQWDLNVSGGLAGAVGTLRCNNASAYVAFTAEL